MIGPVVPVEQGKKLYDLWSDKRFSAILLYTCVHPAEDYDLSQLSREINLYASL